MKATDLEETVPLARDWRWLHLAYLAIAFLLSVHTIGASNFVNYDQGLQIYAAKAGEGSIQREISFIMLIAYGVFHLFRPSRRELRCRNLVGLAAILLGFWTLASYAWSEFPVTSRSRLGGVVALILVAIAVCRRFRSSEIVTGLAILCACYAAIGIPVELALGNFHPLTTDYRYSGTLGANEQGPNCAVAAIAIWYLWRRAPHKKIWAAALVFVLVMMFLTRSRTSLIALVIALPLFQIALIKDLRKRLLAVSIIGVLATCTMWLGWNGFLDLASGLTLGRDSATADPMSLTGRLPLWREVLEVPAKRPLLGFGYGAFWSPDRISDISLDQSWPLSAAHSAVVDILLALGPIGLILYAVALVLALAQAWIRCQVKGEPLAPAFFGTLLGFIFIDGITDSSIVVPSGFLCFCLCLTLVFLGFVAPNNELSRRENLRLSIH